MLYLFVQSSKAKYTRILSEITTVWIPPRRINLSGLCSFFFFFFFFFLCLFVCLFVLLLVRVLCLSVCQLFLYLLWCNPMWFTGLKAPTNYLLLCLSFSFLWLVQQSRTKEGEACNMWLILSDSNVWSDWRCDQCGVLNLPPVSSAAVWNCPSRALIRPWTHQSRPWWRSWESHPHFSCRLFFCYTASVITSVSIRLPFPIPTPNPNPPPLLSSRCGVP